ncbi:hypothetical protein niasHT_000702 [Heterodera trifolii]|uniref:B30.2/SPRY domain-containing protein n=1 Tax=Heterodera trifolii TaxID=157864 RepID=A0ABD2MCT9_9BILA
MARIAQLQQNATMESSSASFDVLGQDGNEVNNEGTSFDDGGQQKYADNSRTTPIVENRRIGEAAENEEQQRGTSKTGTENVNAIVEKCDALFGRVAEIEKQQQQKGTALEEHLEKLDNFIGILKDRFGNELLNAVHPKVRQNIAESLLNWICHQSDAIGRKGRPKFGQLRIPKRWSILGQWLKQYTSDLFLSTPFDFPLFPFISLNDFGDLIETNFGPQFKFDPAKIMLNFLRENYWDANSCDENLQISDNKSLTVLHKGTNSGYFDYVFAKYSILLNKDFRLIFGFAVKQQNKLVGTIRTRKGTYAYESDGDIRINGKGKGINDEYSYSEGDTVGIGVNLITRQLFFTKNGKHLDSSDFFVAPYLADVSFHPFVSLHDDGDQIEANFGPNFKFDFGNSKTWFSLPAFTTTVFKEFFSKLAQTIARHQ